MLIRFRQTTAALTITPLQRFELPHPTTARPVKARPLRGGARRGAAVGHVLNLSFPRLREARNPSPRRKPRKRTRFGRFDMCIYFKLPLKNPQDPDCSQSHVNLCVSRYITGPS